MENVLQGVSRKDSSKKMVLEEAVRECALALIEGGKIRRAAIWRVVIPCNATFPRTSLVVEPRRSFGVIVRLIRRVSWVLSQKTNEFYLRRGYPLL